MSTNCNQVYMTAKETAEFLGISPKYLYQLTHQRKIPYFSPTGRKILFKRSELISFVESARVSSINDLCTEAQTSTIRKGGTL